MEAESENNRHPLIDIMMDLTVALTNNNEEDALAAADRFYQSVCAARISLPARSVICILNIWLS